MFLFLSSHYKLIISKILSPEGRYGESLLDALIFWAHHFCHLFLFLFLLSQSLFLGQFSLCFQMAFCTLYSSNILFNVTFVIIFFALFVYYLCRRKNIRVDHFEFFWREGDEFCIFPPFLFLFLSLRLNILFYIHIELKHPFL